MLDIRDTTAHNAMLVETLAEVLETMAFIGLQPAEETSKAPPELLLLTMDFKGPIRGDLQLFTRQDLGALLSGNMLGTSPEDPAAKAGARDALKELLNVVCGSLLRKIAPTARFHVSLPRLSETSDPKQWQNALRSGDLVLLDAEGSLLGARLEIRG